jgi:glycine cleavage system transcriptional repressor
MSQYAITVVSHDRPGLIADVTEVLTELGANLESSAMSLLQGHFAWTLVVEVDASAKAIRDQLLVVCPRGVTVLSLDDQPEAPFPARDELVVSVHGADRIGIVAGVTRCLADYGGNIVELATHLHQGVYLATIEVEFADRVELPALVAKLNDVAADLGVNVRVHREDAELL